MVPADYWPPSCTDAMYLPLLHGALWVSLLDPKSSLSLQVESLAWELQQQVCLFAEASGGLALGSVGAVAGFALRNFRKPHQALS